LHIASLICLITDELLENINPLSGSGNKAFQPQLTDFTALKTDDNITLSLASLIDEKNYIKLYFNTV